MKLLIWDWDNTLVGSFHALHQTYLTLLERRNTPKEWTLDDTLIQVNYPTAEALLRFLPNENQKKLCNEFYECYDKLEKKIPLFPHAIETLKWTKKNGFTNILVSNKFTDSLITAAKRLKVFPYFDDIYGDGSFPYNKNDKEYAQILLKTYSKATQIFVIGDGFVDMQLGTRLKATNILVKTPFPLPKFKRLKIDYRIQDLSELPAILSE